MGYIAGGGWNCRYPWHPPGCTQAGARSVVSRYCGERWVECWGQCWTVDWKGYPFHYRQCLPHCPWHALGSVAVGGTTALESRRLCRFPDLGNRGYHPPGPCEPACRCPQCSAHCRLGRPDSLPTKAEHSPSTCCGRTIQPKRTPTCPPSRRNTLCRSTSEGPSEERRQEEPATDKRNQTFLGSRGRGGNGAVYPIVIQ